MSANQQTGLTDIHHPEPLSSSGAWSEQRQLGTPVMTIFPYKHYTTVLTRSFEMIGNVTAVYTGRLLVLQRPDSRLKYTVSDNVMSESMLNKCIKRLGRACSG